MDINLVMFKGDGSRCDFPVKKPRTVIGRTNSCDLRIPVPDVSRKHCELVLEDDEVVLRDLESSNGTFCNEKRVLEIELEPGDTIAIGPVRFVVQIEGEPADVNVEEDGTMATEPTVLPVEEAESLEDAGDEPSVAALVDDDAPIDLSEDLDGIDESIELAPMDVDDDDPVAALEAMGEEIDLDDSGSSPHAADDETPRDGG